MLSDRLKGPFSEARAQPKSFGSVLAVRPLLEFTCFCWHCTTLDDIGWHLTRHTSSRSGSSSGPRHNKVLKDCQACDENALKRPQRPFSGGSRTG